MHKDYSCFVNSVTSSSPQQMPRAKSTASSMSAEGHCPTTDGKPSAKPVVLSWHGSTTQPSRWKPSSWSRPLRGAACSSTANGRPVACTFKPRSAQRSLTRAWTSRIALPFTHVNWLFVIIIDLVTGWPLADLCTVLSIQELEQRRAQQLWWSGGVHGSLRGRGGYWQVERHWLQWCEVCAMPNQKWVAPWHQRTKTSDMASSWILDLCVSLPMAAIFVESGGRRLVVCRGLGSLD